MIQGLVYVILLSNPAFILSAFAFAWTQEWSWAIIGITTLIVSLDFVGLSIDLSSYTSGKETFDYIFLDAVANPKTNQKLIELPFDEYTAWTPSIITKQLATEADFFSALKPLRRAHGLTGDFKKIRVYVRQFSGPPFDFLAKSYVSFAGTSFVFLTEHVNSESSSFQKFKFYHELSHVSKQGLTSLANRNARLFKYMLFWALALITCAFDIYSLIVLFVMIIFEVLRWRFHGIDFETKADALAISAIPRQDRPNVLRLCQKIWTKNGQPISLEAFRRLAGLKRSIAALEKDENTLPFGVAWNHYNGIEGAFWFIFIIYLSHQALKIDLFVALIGCFLLITCEIFARFYFHPRTQKIERSLEVCIELGKKLTVKEISH